MSLRDELLTPIPGSNPAGVELRSDPVYDKIKFARREDDDMPQGGWTAERKTADWSQVIKLTKDAIATKSKDLQLAVWMAEAMLAREGLAGFRSALDTIVGLLEQHWEHLYPEIDDGDSEARANTLGSLGGAKMAVRVRRVPLDKAGHDLGQIQQANRVPTEIDAANDSTKAELRQSLVAEGRATPEEIESGFRATPKPWLKALVADIDGALVLLQNLDEISAERFPDEGPSYRDIREALEEVQRTSKQLLKRKLELDPDPVEVVGGTDLTAPVSVPEGVVLPASVGAQLSAIPTSREDAASRIAVSAKYLRQSDPTNPAAYLLLRGFRWGELRASGTSPDPRLLEAPATATRTQLKVLLLDSKWEGLLEACEGVMATPQGRGWIDLQRYALTACEQLGAEFQIVAAALKGALRSLLADIPGLLDMTLMDDTPTANAETRKWLGGVLEAEPAKSASEEGAEDVAPEPLRPRGGRNAALAEVRAGRTDRAIALLMREAASEKTKRGRFLVQTELASIMVDGGHHIVAQPILEELMGSIEGHKLEDWESGDVVARPLALLYQCLERVDGDPSTRQALYLRICRLDPVQAIGFANGGSASA
ncbi:MAG TPA: type VI secretion system protein TssA [Gemmatimonadaceae bacterium]|nr:type VI secretion system protein TssA [Gemmatimonadaceae bacterium]